MSAYDVQNHNFSPEEIYRVDETKLFWNVLPGEMSKANPNNRLTILCCENFYGDHKLKPFVVGPKLPPGIDLGDSVIYKPRKYPDLTPALFRDWFRHSFITEVSKYLQAKNLTTPALMLFDATTNRRTSSIQELKTNSGYITTALLKHEFGIPDGTIMDLVKLKYKKQQLSSSTPLTMRDALMNIRLAWDAIKPTAIWHNWRKMMFDEEGFTMNDRSVLALQKSYIMAEKLARIDIIKILRGTANGQQYNTAELDAWFKDEKKIPNPKEVQLANQMQTDA